MTKVATLGYLALIWALFWLNRDSKERTSIALWVPFLWLAIAGSRPLSQWLQSGPSIDSPMQVLDGSPPDREMFIVLMVLGLLVLARRPQQVARLLSSNLPLVCFFLYCAVSVFWSEFPAVALKRWIKAMGDLFMVLIVLTEVDHEAAVKRLFSWLAFTLIPLSVLLIKYYPDLGRSYSPWTWTPFYGGVTTNKNTLGMICLLFGLASVWRVVTMCAGERSVFRKRQLIAHGVVIAMALWLFSIANSMTSLSCFLMGAGMLVGIHLTRFARKPAFLHVMVAGMVLLSFSTLFLNVGSGFVQGAMARDTATLTGRTDVWRIALSMAGNPIVGTGFESFWLGDRLERMWEYNRDINQAHNGYLEIYLNLGWIGVILLLWLLVMSYRRIVRAVKQNTENSLWLAYFAVMVVYNFTEASFKMVSPIWIVFLLAILAVSKMPKRSPEVPRRPSAITSPQPRLLRTKADFLIGARYGKESN